MRTPFLILAALTTLTSTRPADACGSYGEVAPRIMQLVSHHSPQGGARSFVVWRPAGPDIEVVWRRIAADSYDPMQLGGETKIAHPITITLVGREGTKIVTGIRHVYLSQTFAFPEAASAVEVPMLGAYEVAIEGAHSDAKWIELAPGERGRAAGRALGIVEIAGARRIVIATGATTTSVQL